MRFPEFWSSTFWRRGGAQRTAQETAVLDNAFALIDGADGVCFGPKGPVGQPLGQPLRRAWWRSSLNGQRENASCWESFQPFLAANSVKCPSLRKERERLGHAL